MKNNIIKKIIKKELIVLKKQKIATQTIVFSIFSLLLVIGMTLLMAFVFGSNKVTLDFEPDSKLKQQIMKSGKMVSVAYDYNEAMELLETTTISYFVSKKDNQYYIYYNDLLCNQELINSITQIITDYCKEGTSDYEIKTISETIDGSEVMYLSRKEPLSIGPGMILVTTMSIATLAAINMIAVEKEKGTLETMFTFPIKRKQIIMGKFCTSFIIALGILVFLTLSIFITNGLLTSFLDIYEKIKMPTFIELLLLIGSFLSFAMFISSYGIWKSLKSKSAMSAEARMVVLNILIMVLIPASIVVQEGNTISSLIPIINQFFIILSVFNQGISKMYCILSIIMNLVVTWVICEKINDITDSDKVLFE